MNFDVEIGIIEKYHLTPSELFVIHCILVCQENDDKSYLRRYLQVPDNKKEFRNILLNLQNKKIINKTYSIPFEGEVFDPYEVEFNKTFIKGLHKESFQLGEELFKAYPVFGNINGDTVQINTVSKKFNSLEDFYLSYGKAINWNPETHQEILDIVKWGSENHVINCSLASFLIDRRWVAIEKLRSGEVGNINFNTIRIL